MIAADVIGFRDWGWRPGRGLGLRDHARTVHVPIPANDPVP